MNLLQAAAKARKPAENPPWGTWVGEDVSAPPLQVPNAPARPIVDATMPDHPNRVQCRHCSKWVDLGADPATTLINMWHLWSQDYAARGGERWDPTQPAGWMADQRTPPQHPSKVACPWCSGWTDLGPDPAARLRQEWLDWVDSEQERADTIWRASPAHAITALFAARESAERQEDRAKKHEVEARREELRGRRIRALIDHGLSPIQANAQADAEFDGAAP